MKKIIQAVFILISIYTIQAQVDGTIDDSFLTNNKGQKGVNGQINTIVEQADGKLIIGGVFDTYNQIFSPKLVRVNTDGTLDSSFNQTLLRDSNSSIKSIVIQPDGKILVAGSFEMRTAFPDNDLLEEDIMRLNSDGTRDTTFIASENTSGCGDIRSIALQPDGKIIVVGDISFCVGSTIDNNENIIRLNPDGSLDETFTPVVTDIGSGSSGEPIQAVSIQDDGKILIAGNFNEVNGVSQLRLARLNIDGSFDPTYTIGSGFNEVIKSIKLQPDGKLLVAGAFTEFNAVSHNQIVRLNTDGSLDTSFNSGDGVGRFQPSNGFIESRDIEHINIQSDGKILIGGDYNRYNENPVSRFTRLNGDGTLDISFFNVDDLGIGIAVINSSLILSNGDFVIGGNIDKHNQYRKAGIIKLNSIGEVDLSFNSGHGPTYGYFSTRIRTIQKASGSKFYVGGLFREYDDVFSKNFVRVNTDGSIDASFNTGTDELTNGFDGEVFDAVEQPDGKVIVVGEFENYNSNVAPGIIRLNNDGTVDNTFNIGSGVDTASGNRIEAITIQTDGKLLIGGFFAEFNSVASRNFGRLNTDGSLDVSFDVGTGSSSAVEFITLLDNGQIIIPAFIYNGEMMSGRLAKINTDGSRDMSFSAAGISTGRTEIVRILNDGKLLVGGSYSSQGKLLRLNADGSLDATFNPADVDGGGSRIHDIKLQADGKIIIGGNFDNIGARIIRGLARLNNDGTFDETFNPENLPEDPDTFAGTDDFSNTVYTLELRDSGQLLLGGDFRSYNTQPKAPLIAVHADIPETLSLNNFENENVVRMYPNPATSQFTINSNEVFQTIEIYSVSGKMLIKIENINQREITLNTSHLSSGIYLLKVSETYNTTIKKLLIK